MIKNEFISAIKPELKRRGYRKNGMYWYKRCNGFTCCINLQTSNWDSNNYYINVGLSLDDSPTYRATQLNWYCRHRVVGVSANQNLLPEELFSHLDQTFEQIHSKFEIRDFLIRQNAVEMPNQNQFWY